MQDEDCALLETTSAAGQPSIKDTHSPVRRLAACIAARFVVRCAQGEAKTHQPCIDDWKLAKSIAYYLKGTQRLNMRMTPGVEARKTPTLGP